MVDDDGVSMSVDKAMETWKLAVVYEEDSRLVVTEYGDGLGRAGRTGRWELRVR